MADLQYTSIHQHSGASGGVETDWPTTTTTFRVNSTNTSLRRVRFFIPPGASSAYTAFYVGQATGSLYNYSARIGQPPVLPPANGTSNNGFTIAELESADRQGRNSSGYCIIIKSEGGLHRTVGKWLYVNFAVVSGALQTISATFTNGYPLEYTDWYDNYAVWDSVGDPIIGNVVPKSYTLIAASKALKVTWSPLGFYIPSGPKLVHKRMVASSGSFKVSYLIFTWRPPPITIVPFLNIQCPFCGHSIINITLNIPSYINEP